MSSTNELDYGTDQNVGLSGRGVQEDVIRLGSLTTAGGLALLVGVVADGSATPGRGEAAAKLVVSQVRQSLRAAEGRDVNDAVRQAMMAADQALRQAEMAAALTLVVIHERQLYVAQGGSSRAYLVRGAQVQPLAEPAVTASGDLNQMLGRGRGPGFAVGALPGRDSLPLEPGDHVVLCSDGLVGPRPDGKGPCLDPQTEMSPILNDRRIPALESARTLVSLAVGHGAQDNVSVAVISVPPKRKPVLLLGLLAAVLLLALVVGSAALAITLSQPAPTPTPTLTPVPLPTGTPLLVDSGSIRVGTVTGGMLVTDGQEEPLRPGKDLVPPAEVQTGDGGQLQLLLMGDSNVYLPTASRLRIEEIDFPGREDETILRLLAGGLLLHRPDSGDTVTVLSEADEVLGVLAPAGGTLAITVDGRITCFAGACQVASGLSLAAGQEVVGRGTPAGIPVDQYTLWRSLCPSCLPETPE